MIVSGNSWATDNSQTALITTAKFEVDLKALHSIFLNSQLLLSFFSLTWSTALIQVFSQCFLVFLIQKLFPLQYVDRFSYMSNTDEVAFSAFAHDLS